MDIERFLGILSHLQEVGLGKGKREETVQRRGGLRTASAQLLDAPNLLAQHA